VGLTRLGKSDSLLVMRFATIHLDLFDRDLALDEVIAERPPGSRFAFCGVDEPMTEQGLMRRGSIWGIIALFEEEVTATAALDAHCLAARDRPVESWSALLAPIHHRGEINWLDRATPGAIFTTGEMESAGPVAVMTSVGFDFATPDFDLGRPVRFGLDVNAQRARMAETAGLSLQLAFYASEFTTDAITFSVWQDEKAIGRFAYAPGPHRTQVDRFHAEKLADRSSFTRFRILETRGSWGGQQLG